MPPNWLVQWSPIIENFATALAVIGGAVIAAMGLNTWKKQLRGQTDYDLARRLMKAVYKVRDAIQQARSPWIMHPETEAAVKAVGLAEYEKDIRAKQEGAVYEVRLGKVADQFTELRTEMLEAEATWGSEWVVTAKDLDRCFGDLAIAFREHVQAFGPNPPTRDVQQRQAIDDVVYRREDKTKDKFAQKVDAAVKKFEDVARRHLGGKITKRRQLDNASSSNAG